MPLQKARYASKSTTKIECILEVHEWQGCVWQERALLMGCVRVIKDRFYRTVVNYRLK